MDNHHNTTQEEEDSKIFPQKLMDILSDPDVLVQESISWLPHGKAFKIRNRGQFEKHVMPKFFHRKAKYSSFTRKLNRWYVHPLHGTDIPLRGWLVPLPFTL